MSNKTTIELTSKELETVISSLLFTSSVSVMAEIDEKLQMDLVKLAAKLKKTKPAIKLKFLEFVKEEEYEDLASSKIYDTFKDNINIVTFEQV